MRGDMNVRACDVQSNLAMREILERKRLEGRR